MAKGVFDTGNKTCNICSKIDGVLYDWSMDITILPSFPHEDVCVEQHLPDGPEDMDGYIPNQTLWRPILQKYHMGVPSISYKYNIANYSQYSLMYYGLKVRLFKYANKIYLLSNSGFDGRHVFRNSKFSAWAIVRNKGGSATDNIFDQGRPHGRSQPHHRRFNRFPIYH